MSKQSIGLGSTANDGNGDPLRTALDKVNDNFDELYNALGNGTTLDLSDFASLTDLASTSNGDGAALIGIEDSGGLITADTVEGALAENRAAIDAIEADYLTASSIANMVETGDAITGLDGTAWRVFYTDGSGDVTELALGADGTFLKSNGATSAPSFATPAGSGDVSKVGTPADNQVGVWTGDGTIEGGSSFTYTGSVMEFVGGLLFNERADHAATPGAGKAELWVSNDTTQKLVFTDDAGTDKEVVFAGSGTNVASYTGIVGISSGSAVDVDSTADLAARLSDGRTGTGAFVCASSPTLTTPALGTPSAVTLTNGTGLPISTGVSGLGANVATFLGAPSSSNLAAAVTGETGSGALVFGTAPTISSPKISHSITTDADNYTLDADDQSAIILMTSGSANQLTIPTNASVAFPLGTKVEVWSTGAGTTTIAGDTGVTLQGNGGSASAGSCDIQTQYGGATLTKVATNTWMVGGDIDAVS